MPSQLEVLTESLKNALDSKAKYDEMAKRKSEQPEGRYVQHVDPRRDDYEPSETVRHLRTKPLRIDIDFDDPLKTRRQLARLASALVRALAYSEEHDRGAYNQLADMRHVLRMAVIDIQHMRGKKKAGNND